MGEVIGVIAVLASVVAAFYAIRGIYRGSINVGRGKIVSGLIAWTVSPFILMLPLIVVAIFFGEGDGADTPSGVASSPTQIDGAPLPASLEPVDELAIAEVAKAPEPKATQAPEDPWAEKRAEIEHGGDFGITPDQYTNRFNAKISEYISAARLSIKRTESEMAQNSFQGMLTERLAVTGNMKISNDMVTGATLIGQGDGSQDSGAGIMMAAAAVFAAATGEQMEESIQHVIALLKQGGSADAKIVGKDASYHYSMVDGVGAMFTVQPR